MCPTNQPGYNVQGYVNLIMHITMIRTQHPADLGSRRNCRFCSQLWVIDMRRRVSYSWGALKITTLFQSRYCSLQLYSDCYYSCSDSGPHSLETIGVISAEVIWSVYTEGGLDVLSIQPPLCIRMDSKRSRLSETQDNQKQVQAESGCCSYQDRTSSAEPSCVVALIPARPNRRHKMRVL